MTVQGGLYPIHPILIVDDEEQALTSMSITLRSAGYNNLQLCSDSRDVPGMLDRETFGLVILDLNMPYLTGHDIISQSMARDNRPPMVIVTASSQVTDYAEGAAGGVIDYLVKPIDREHLIGVVRRALTRPSSNSRSRMTRNYLLSDRITAGSPPADSSEAAGVIDMLEQTRREYWRLIGSLPTPYVLLEEDSYRIRFCNDSFLSFLGSDSAAAAEQLSFFDLFSADDRARAIRTLTEKGERRDAELRGRTPGGRSFVIVGSFLWTSDGYVEGGFVDVTEHKQMEQDLARAHRMEVVGRLSAGLAHDFNNTLLVVSGFSELIDAEEGVTPTVKANVEEIRIAVAKASKMIEQLFSIGRAPVKTKACIDLNGVLREAESSLRQHLRMGQTLILSLEADNPMVDIAASQLDQVIRNLVLNARDAMPAGGTITITTKSAEGPLSPNGAAPVLMEIRDTGKGMDADTLARIFEPFFTTKTASEGTGLGLSMVQMIIEAAGGQIRVESTPGGGTLFLIMLPSASETVTPDRRSLTEHTTGGES